MALKIIFIPICQKCVHLSDESLKLQCRVIWWRERIISCTYTYIIRNGFPSVASRRVQVSLCNSEMDANVYELVYMIQVMFGFDAAQADQKEGKRRA